MSAGEWTHPHDMSKALTYLLADMMGDVTFSRNWGMLKDEENRHVIDLMADAALAMNTVNNPTSTKTRQILRTWRTIARIHAYSGKTRPIQIDPTIFIKWCQ